MPYCTQCGYPNNEGAKFCSGCGIALDEVPVNDLQDAGANEPDNNGSSDDDKKINHKQISDTDYYSFNRRSTSSTISRKTAQSSHIIPFLVLFAFIGVISVIALSGISAQRENESYGNTPLSDSKVITANSNAKLAFTNASTYSAQTQIMGNMVPDGAYVFRLTFADYSTKGDGTEEDFRSAMCSMMGTENEQYVYIYMKNGSPSYTYWSESAIFSVNERDPDTAYRNNADPNVIIGSYPNGIEY